MTITVGPVNAVTGAPSYTGKTFRQILGAALFGSTSSRPLGARSGVRIGTPTTTVSVSGSTVTIAPHQGIIDLQASAAAGPYLYANDANTTLTLNAPHATLTRIDLITARIDDPAESDGSSVPAVVFVYTAGTASGSPVAPSPATSRELTLATVTVPASGGGSAVVTWAAPYAATSGGFIPVRNTTERGDLATWYGPTTEDPLLVARKDATAGDNLELTVDGTNWFVLRGRDTGWTTASGSGNYSSGSINVRRQGDMVSIQGTINRNSGDVTNGDTVMTLPSTYRPSNTLVFPVFGTGSFRLQIATTGVVSVTSTPTSTSSAISIAISFLV
jgi:hypothetical protein